MFKRSSLLIATVSVLLLGAGFALAQEEDGPLPFPLTLGGQTPKIVDPTIGHAVLANPVAANAELAVTTDEAMIIVNIFDSDEKGEAKPGQPLVVLMQNVKKIPINKTMDGRAPAPGYHLMNVVAGGKTARVVFLVK